MAVEAKFPGPPLQVLDTPEIRARIKAISDAEKTSQAAVCRDLHEYGIEWREQVSRERLAASE